MESKPGEFPIPRANAIFESFKIWAFTVLIAPVLLLLLLFMQDPPELQEILMNILQFYILIVLIGGLFSLPAFIMLIFCFYLLQLLDIYPHVKLIILILFVQVACYLTFYFSLGEKEWLFNWDGEIQLSLLAYLFVITFFAIKYGWKAFEISDENPVKFLLNLLKKA